MATKNFMAEPKTKLKSAVQIAEIAAEAEKETFPKDLKAAFALLEKVKSTVVSNEDEGDKREARILALSKHIAKIQQGLPVIATKSGDIDHFQRSKVLTAMKLDRLTRTNPEIKELVAKLDTIVKAVASAENLENLQSFVAKL
jgi:predicted  nucleic acid-binding Zn-ribbon protein